MDRRARLHSTAASERVDAFSPHTSSSLSSVITGAALRPALARLCVIRKRFTQKASALLVKTAKGTGLTKRGSKTQWSEKQRKREKRRERGREAAERTARQGKAEQAVSPLRLERGQGRRHTEEKGAREDFNGKERRRSSEREESVAEHQAAEGLCVHEQQRGRRLAREIRGSEERAQAQAQRQRGRERRKRRERKNSKRENKSLFSFALSLSLFFPSAFGLWRLQPHHCFGCFGARALCVCSCR